MSNTIIRLVDTYRRHATGAESTIARLASGSGATIARLRRGADITTRRAARIIQWLSDHWPPDAEWPADIPRPPPRRDAA